MSAKAFNRQMDLIRCNATDSDKCKWITLTYADTMTDHKRVYEDGKMFLHRLQNFLDKRLDLYDGQKSFKRITVAEPQGENHKVYDADGLALYFAVNLTGVEYSDETESEEKVIEKMVDGESKQFIKGGYGACY